MSHCVGINAIATRAQYSCAHDHVGISVYIYQLKIVFSSEQKRTMFQWLRQSLLLCMQTFFASYPPRSSLFSRCSSIALLPPPPLSFSAQVESLLSCLSSEAYCRSASLFKKAFCDNCVTLIKVSKHNFVNSASILSYCIYFCVCQLSLNAAHIRKCYFWKDIELAAILYTAKIV